MSEAEERRRAEIRAAFTAERGFWAPSFETMLQHDPEFVAAYLDFSATPWRTGPLSPKVKELVYIAIDAATTHLHAAGAASHVRAALRHGATADEIAAVLELASLIGLQSIDLGTAILADVAGESAAPAIAEARIAAEGWRRGVIARAPLEIAVIELIGVAVNAATTHLHEDATRRHVVAALAAGATPAEVAEVLELVSVLGIHAATLGMPILQEAVQERATP
ncbi:MAG: carboxymuconolactone decarboxylase family protein [Microbacterium sp.]|uniref:carboxymuconolactone decarboxylase family protein n=1 Tax=Microbacterium sp. TaxID=51671 RepID=UPI0039E4D101